MTRVMDDCVSLREVVDEKRHADSELRWIASVIVSSARMVDFSLET